jgi:hypothetical protein
MSVPFLDLSAAYQALKAEFDAAVARTLGSGWYIGGPEVASFEQAFAASVEAANCVGVANGLDALHIALRALGIGPGDEVITASDPVAIARQQSGRIVGGPVVDHDHLIVTALRQRAVDRFAEQGRAIVCGDDNADVGHGSGLNPLPSAGKQFFVALESGRPTDRQGASSLSLGVRRLD